MPEPSGAPPTGRDQDRDDDPRPPEEATSAEDTAPGSPAAPPPTNLARLRQQYEEAHEDRRETIPIAPGIYDGNLAARYHPIEWSATRKRLKRAARRGMSEETELNFAAGQLAKACDEILIRVEDGGDYVPLHQTVARWKDGPPVRYDTRLAEAIGIDIPAGASAAAICRLVFIDPHVLDAHFMQFDAWLRGVIAADDDSDDEDRMEALEDRPT